MARSIGPVGHSPPPVQQQGGRGVWRPLGEQQQQGITLSDRLGSWAELRVRQQRAQSRRLRRGHAESEDGS